MSAADLEVRPEGGGERLPMRRPLVPIALCFAAGIWLADATGLGGALAWPVAAVCLALVLVLARLRLGGPLRFIAWLFVVIAVGWARGELPPIGDERPPDARAVLRARALTGWQVGPNQRRLVVDARSVWRPGEAPQPLTGRVRLTVLPEQAACPRVLPGDDLRVWVRVQEPLGRHNPGTRDPSLDLRRKGIAYTGLVSGCDQVLVQPDDRRGGVVRLAERARAAVREHLANAAAGQGARAVFEALTIGETAGIPPQIRSSFQRAGLAHLLAISGLHLACVALGLYWLLVRALARIRFFALRLDVRRLAAGLVLPVLAFYVLLAGAGLPALRAGAAVTCFLVAVMARRRPDPFQTLAVAGLVVLCLWPQSLFEVSFQLSFAAVAAILVIAPPMAARLGVALRQSPAGAGRLKVARVRALQLLLISFSASLGTAPLVALHFHQVSLVGIVANLVAVPLAAWIIVPLGLATAVGLVLGETLAGLFSGAGLWLSKGLIGWAGLFSAPDWTAVWVAGPSPLELAAWYCGLVMLARWSLARWARIGAVLAGVALAASWAWGVIAPRFDDAMRVTALDVGQGDSLLVELPGGERLLVDGGGSYSGTFDTGRYLVAPALWARGISHLDAVVVTHRHPDHVGGLASVVRLFRPGEIWSAGDLAAEEVSRPLVTAAAEVGADLRRLHAGDRPLVRADLAVEVLWPPEDPKELSENERSMVLRLRYGRLAVLLTGDLELAGEQGLLDRAGVDLAADVLKVGHHGSKNATSDALLLRVQPRLAIISVGSRNRYRLPHPDLLERLQAAGVRIFRTDLHGAVSVSMDGRLLEVSTAVAGIPVEGSEAASETEAGAVDAPAVEGQDR